MGLFQNNKSISGDFLVELKPVDSNKAYDRSINVIQGIAAFENGWFTSQTSANKYLLINYLNKDGESEYNIRISINSHAQDLSLEQVAPNILYLYTTLGHYNKEGASGLLRLKVELPEEINGKRDMSKLNIKVDKSYHLSLNNSTPTLSEDKKTFAIRSGNSILVTSKESILNDELNSNMIQFKLDKTQLKDGYSHLWFQGIALKNNLVYCLTGNNSLDSPKYIYVYNLKGEVVEKHNIDKNKFAKSIGHKYEPEGLTFVGNNLYYTIMTKGKTGGNKKFLYRLNQ
jgi:hypothetical protein